MSDRGAAFRALHRPGDPFVLANAWDEGSAKVLKALGAQAIGTSSAAHAFTLGRPDGGHVGRDEALAHAERLVAATRKPVNALAVGPLAQVTRVGFARMGVARISLGAALARVTHRAIVDLGRAILEDGDFSGLARGIPGAEVDRLLGG